ncbi:PH domain-containing protein [Streptomyces albus]|uniref:PH domain-containing protein n=2 Tax=Streptomyces TaxID=1883 RepID=A0A6C1CEQ1_9ACTN|nr:PH domain-containing protein [Streptomyces albus]TGG86562.1 PH domain-containing protein [Streptomyces albus]
MKAPRETVCLSAAALRRNWWWTGFLSLLFAGAAVATALNSPQSSRWWWVGGLGVTGLASVFYMINRGCGRTLLTERGMEFRTFLSRRHVPWADIVEIETRAHYTRGGSWWDLRVVRAQGRPLTIPGAFAQRLRDPEFQQKLATIHEHWSRASGVMRSPFPD